MILAKAMGCNNVKADADCMLRRKSWWSVAATIYAECVTTAMAIWKQTAAHDISRFFYNCQSDCNWDDEPPNSCTM